MMDHDAAYESRNFGVPLVRWPWRESRIEMNRDLLVISPKKIPGDVKSASKNYGSIRLFGCQIRVFEGSLEVKLPTIWTVEKQR